MGWIDLQQCLLDWHAYFLTYFQLFCCINSLHKKTLKICIFVQLSLAYYSYVVVFWKCEQSLVCWNTEYMLVVSGWRVLNVERLFVQLRTQNLKLLPDIQSSIDLRVGKLALPTCQSVLCILMYLHWPQNPDLNKNKPIIFPSVMHCIWVLDLLCTILKWGFLA